MSLALDIALDHINQDHDVSIVVFEVQGYRAYAGTDGDYIEAGKNTYSDVQDLYVRCHDCDTNFTVDYDEIEWL